MDCLLLLAGINLDFVDFGDNAIGALVTLPDLLLPRHMVREKDYEAYEGLRGK